MADYFKMIQQAYVAYYGRPGDPDGVEWWAARLEQVAGDLSEIIAAFGNSEEFNARYGGLSFADLVNGIYQQCFNRDAESGGLAYYVGELEAGRKTLQTITLDVLYGAQNDDFEIVTRKVEFAQYFTQQIKAGNLEYAGNQAAEAAKGLMAQINNAVSQGEFMSMMNRYDPTGNGNGTLESFFEQEYGEFYDTLTSIVGLNDHTGALSTAALRAAIIPQTGETAYYSLFDPASFPGSEDGSYSVDELGIPHLGVLPATLETIESLFYGTMINALQRIDMNEINELTALVTANPGNPPDPATMQQMIMAMFEDEAAVPIFSDPVIANTITQAVTVMVGNVQGNLFDGIFEIF